MSGEYNESRKKSILKYAKENLKRVPLDMKKTEYEQLKAAADAVGMKVNTFIKTAINEKIEKEASNIE